MASRLAIVGVSLLVSVTTACGSSADNAVRAEQSSSPPTSKTVEANGVSMRIPTEWTGWAYRRAADGITGLRVANYSIPEEDNDIAETAQTSMDQDAIVLVVLVGDGPPPQVTKWGSWVHERLPLEFRRADLQPLEGFDAPAEAKRAVEVKGRSVLVFAAFGSEVPCESTLETTNAVLGSLSIQSPPATSLGARRTESTGLGFAEDNGWRTVETRLQDGTPVAWIANVPFATAEDGRAFPDATVANLPPRGIVIVAVGPRPYTGDADFDRIDLPVTLSEGRLFSEGYEGQPAPHVSYFFADTWVAEKLLNVWGYIGESPPSAAAEAEANDMLAALRVP